MTHNLQYNTQKEPIILKEYGRNIQSLVNLIKDENDQERKLRLSNTLVKLMKQLNPSLRDNNDIFQRLWHHLHIIADFELDIKDAPYEAPTKEQVLSKPERLPYPQQKLKFRHYGKQVEVFINQAIALQDEKEKEGAIIKIAKVMKHNYMQWNNDRVNDNLILNNLKEMSGGLLTLDPELVNEHNLLKVVIKNDSIRNTDLTNRKINKKKSIKKAPHKRKY